ncbi:acid protease, partial [Aulographum hederae CBS 113979]
PSPHIIPPSQQWDGNDGRWSTFRIQVGSPGQEFRILPSTAGSEIFLPLSGGCSNENDPENCSELRGIEDVNGFESSGLNVSLSSTWSRTGTYELELDSHLGHNARGLYGKDALILGAIQQAQGPMDVSRRDPVVLHGQTIAGMVSKQWFLGLMGLNTRPASFSTNSPPVPSLLYNLKNQSYIPSMTYAYTAGAAYPSRTQVGSLILGGYDATRLSPTDLTIGFAANDYKAPVVGVISIVGMDTLQGYVSFTTSSTFLAAVDSSIPGLWLPESVCDAFEVAFGLSFDSSTELYLVNDTIHERLTILNPSITFKIANNTDNNGRSTNIVLPYAAFDLQASWPIYETATRYFPIRRAANDSQYTLGRTLLQEAYLIVDFERQNFTLAQALFPQPDAEPEIVSIESPGNVSVNRSAAPHKLKTGVLIGIAVGAAIVLLCILVLAWYFWQRRR